MYESQVLHNLMLRSDVVASKVGKQVPRDLVQPYALSRLMRMPLYVAIIDPCTTYSYTLVKKPSFNIKVAYIFIMSCIRFSRKSLIYLSKIAVCKVLFESRLLMIPNNSQGRGVRPMV